MKNFESFMAQKLEEFLLYRKGLGYSMKPYRAYLYIFDRYLKETKAEWSSFHPAFFLDMIANLKMQSGSVNKILGAVRVLFQFLVRRHYLDENPLRHIPDMKENTVVPFVFSPQQIDQLLKAICKGIRKTKGHFLHDFALYIAVVLLARCGMRISEPLGLLTQHYRRDDKTIYIEKTKFKKDRLIPIPMAVSSEIDNYLSVRKSLSPHNDYPYLLLGRTQKPLTDQQVRPLFRKALKDIGLEQPRKIIGHMNFNPPTPHSLRHSFAINTLKSIKQRGESTLHALPVLAAYLGHSTYTHTALYLKFLDAEHRQNLADFAISHQEEI
jgi:site-specific recombinase XerD